MKYKKLNRDLMLITIAPGTTQNKNMIEIKRAEISLKEKSTL